MIPYDEPNCYDPDVCEGCGLPFGEGHCPYCCGNEFCPASAECDWCTYRYECEENDFGYSIGEKG